jgi:hypothetical protein
MAAKNVHWLFPKEISLDEIKRSHLASMRLRAAVAADALKRRGDSVTFGEHLPPSLDVLVVPKIGADGIDARSRKWIELIDKAKSRGAKIVVDYTDHHLGFISPMSSFYTEVIIRGDILAVPSISMKNNLPDVARQSAFVVPDAVEYDLVKPKPTRNLKPVLLWFGHSSNLQFLVDFTSRFSLVKCCELIISTNLDGLDWIKRNHRALNLPKTELIPWSIRGLPELAARADLALLPTGVFDPRKSGASANRLLTALALGLPVLAQSLRSYELFKEYYTDIDNDDIYSVIHEPSSQHCKVIAAQNRILTSFLSESIGKEWISLLNSLGNHN